MSSCAPDELTHDTEPPESAPSGPGVRVEYGDPCGVRDIATISTAPPPKDTEPCAAMPDSTAALRGFTDQCNERWEQGRLEYGDKTFERPVDEVLGEMQEECADVRNYGAIARRGRVLDEQVDNAICVATHYAWLAWRELQWARHLVKRGGK